MSPSTLAQHGRAPRRCALIAALALLGCRASPPGFGDGGFVPPAKSPYPTIARCTPPDGHTVPPCPGEYCADNALGPPDGKTVDLTACTALDLVFTGGVVQAQAGKSSLELTLGRATGATRVEGSKDGTTFVLIGYIVQSSSSLPYGIDAGCQATLSGLKATLPLSRCKELTEASFLRLIPDAQATGEKARIDAVAALTFVPAE